MARRRGVLAALAQAQREAEQRQRNRARADLLAQQRAYATDYEQRRRWEAASRTAELDHVVAELGNVLGATLDVDDYLDLRSLHPTMVNVPFDDGVVPPVGPAPTLENFLPPAGTVGRLLTSATRRQQQESRAHELLARAAYDHDQRLRSRADAVHRARHAHEQHHQQLARQHQEQVDGLKRLQRDLDAGRPEGVVAYLDLVLERAVYPDGFPHSWEMKFHPLAKQLVLDYELPNPDVVPVLKAHRYVKASDTITSTARPKTQIRSLYASVVAQTALRVVHEILEADRSGQVAEVCVNAVVTAISPATGQQTSECLVSVRTTRQQFLALQLRSVDPAVCLRHLGARVSRTPAELTGVRPLVDINGDVGGVTVTPARVPTRPPGFHLEGPTPSATPTRASTPARADRVSPRDLPTGTGAGRRVAHDRATELRPGQNVAVSSAIVDVDLVAGAGHDADLSVLLVGASGTVVSDADFVFFNNPVGAGGAVVLHGGDDPRGCTVDLPALPDAVTRVLLVASTDQTRSVGTSPAVRLSTDAPVSTLSYQPTGTEAVAALVYGEFYRREGGWRFRALGQGYSDGLAGLARDFGVQVD